MPKIQCPECLARPHILVRANLTGAEVADGTARVWVDIVLSCPCNEILGEQELVFAKAFDHGCVGAEYYFHHDIKDYYTAGQAAFGATLNARLQCDKCQKFIELGGHVEAPSASFINSTGVKRGKL